VVVSKSHPESDNGDPWKPLLEVANRVCAMLVEVHRVLTPTGLFTTIAFGQVQCYLINVLHSPNLHKLWVLSKCLFDYVCSTGRQDNCNCYAYAGQG
jgi:ubiquinone/menaquinone biosynthesis C-methylase UbiE